MLPDRSCSFDCILWIQRMTPNWLHGKSCSHSASSTSVHITAPCRPSPWRSSAAGRRKAVTGGPVRLIPERTKTLPSRSDSVTQDSHYMYFSCPIYHVDTPTNHIRVGDGTCTSLAFNSTLFHATGLTSPSVVTAMTTSHLRHQVILRA